MGLLITHKFCKQGWGGNLGYNRLENQPPEEVLWRGSLQSPPLFHKAPHNTNKSTTRKIVNY